MSAPLWCLGFVGLGDDHRLCPEGGFGIAPSLHSVVPAFHGPHGLVGSLLGKSHAGRFVDGADLCRASVASRILHAHWEVEALLPEGAPQKALVLALA